MLSYPSDEVGNHLVSLDQLDEAGIDPWHDVLDLEQFPGRLRQGDPSLHRCGLCGFL